jgi:hypothetical protein
MPCLPPFQPLIPANLLDDYHKEERIQLAIDEIQHSRTTPDQNEPYSVRSAATHFQVPRSTLSDRMSGVPTRSEAHRDECLLSPEQECVLVEWIKTQGRRGIPMNRGMVRDYVEDILKHPVGKCWVTRFKVC